MTTAAQSWPEVVQHLHQALHQATRERRTRPALVDAPCGGVEHAWEAHERAVMHEQVNRLRRERGAGPVGVEAVLGAERGACGHFDYVGTYAVGCARLVWGRS